MAPFDLLPALAIELVASALQRLSEGEESDPARRTLPLVCRSWAAALRLWPGRYEQVTITAADLPAAADFVAAANGGALSGSAWSRLYASHSNLLSWFKAHGGSVRRLAVRLQSSQRCCGPPLAEDALKAVLVACAPGLEALHLELRGSPLMACHLWRRVALVAEPEAACRFPRLRQLTLCLEGSPLASQAENTVRAERALTAAAKHHSLESLAVQLRGIRLLELPPALAGLPRLHSLRLSFDPQMPGLLFPTPAALVRGLPPSLRCLALEHPPLPGDAALELAGKLPRLRSFCLAWQPDWEVAYL